MLNDELLSVWLQLTNVIDNERLVEGMPFNEALVCGLLSGGCRTASELCAETRILKSQMNAILRSLEGKGVIAPRRTGAASNCASCRRAVPATPTATAGLWSWWTGSSAPWARRRSAP